MGKYIRKCKGIGELAVMDVAQVGVRTRARALAMEETSSKRRKVTGGDLELSSSLAQTSSNSLHVYEDLLLAENSNVRKDSMDQSPRHSSDHGLASRCSSNGSTEVSKEKLNFVDLDEESVETETSTYKFDCRERRGMGPLSEQGAETSKLDSTASLSEANSRDESKVGKMPSEAQLEEFFGAAEKEVHKKYTAKYNFDFVKEEPVEGRYEWVRLKQ